MSELDRKAADVFAGKVVRKDLVRSAKTEANVPAYVLEYLLGKYCATDDRAAIDAGMRVVRNMLTDNFVRPGEANRVQSLVREKGKYLLIDKIRVRYASEEDRYWAEFVNFGHKFVHVPEHYVRQYDRLLMGGIWAQVTLTHRYDEDERGKRSPFWIEDLTPIQLGSFDFEEYCQGRAQFTTDEWIDLLIRSIGMEPNAFDRRTKLLLLCRLIPLCESNYNLIELGPRGTGKSYAFQELSPYALLLTGPTTVANLFYNMASGKIGLVGIWDAVAFDEVADLQKMPKEVVTTLKTYCESGTFARGRDALTGYASLAMFGNTNQPVDEMVRTSHLFMPLPAVIREDMAFLDRLHFYLPGWEIPKMRMEFFTNHYGFIVDYLAEALREMRQHPVTDLLDRSYSLGSHLNARDVKAVRKTVGGLLKLIHPHGEVAKDDLEEILALALEGRRRVKEQLKKLGSFEYHQTSFSYIDAVTREETYVGVPEDGGRDLIAADPLSPGSVYAASGDDQGRVALYRLEVGVATGTGRLRTPGSMDPSIEQSLQHAFAYFQAHETIMGVAQVFDRTDFYVEAVDLLANRAHCEPGVALVVAMHSALTRTPVLPALVILGDIAIGGTLHPPDSLIEPLRTIMDNGGRRALIPTESKRNFLEVPGDIVEHVDPIFYSDPPTAAFKALGVK